MSNAPTPQTVGGGLTFTQISAGGLSDLVHACGITTRGSAYCWGRYTSGQLGNGDFSGDRSSPVAVLAGYQFRAISAGKEHTCGVTTAGVALCWGSAGTDGRTGLGESGNARAWPMRVVNPTGRMVRRW